MIKKKIFLILTFSLILFNPLFSKSIDIKVKILNEIITNIDIENEKKYLIFLNNKLNELEKTRLDKIAQNSLIKEIIKRNELEKFFNLNEKSQLISIAQRNLLRKKKIKDLNQLKNILKDKEINYDKLQDKMQIDALWNQLVYQKYSNNLIIDKKDLRKKILDKSNKMKKFEYNLSEIIFNENISENLDTRINNIKKSIDEIGFENTANVFSLSSTGKNGGLIGWVNELQISELINNNIKNLKIGEISKPIKIQSGYLLIKINDKRKFEQKIDVEDQLEKLINKEINRQLNNFSIIFYKRIKKNIEINEY